MNRPQATVKTDALAQQPHPTPHPRPDACLNCGTAARGSYCHQCGQATHLHVPSAREFLHEFLGHYVALEGKLWKSLALLLFKPGFLSREYIEGRRVRYLEPLRLYLTFSIIFFALFKLSGMQLYDPEVVIEPPSARAPAQSKTDMTVLGPATRDQAETFESFKKMVSGWAGQVHPVLGQKVERFLSQPTQVQQDAIKRAFYGYTPYAIFALMPLFAAYLKLLYLGSGRRYGEHFLFALHSNAFAFLMLSVMLLLPGGWDTVEFLMVLWLLFYLPTAMRRVYGGGRAVTALRWIVLMSLHFLSLVVAVLLAVGQALMG